MQGDEIPKEWNDDLEDVYISVEGCPDAHVVPGKFTWVRWDGEDIMFVPMRVLGLQPGRQYNVVTCLLDRTGMAARFEAPIHATDAEAYVYETRLGYWRARA